MKGHGIEIEKEELIASMAINGRIDGRSAIFNHNYDKKKKLPFLPPFVQAGFQLPADSKDLKIAEELASFETLSLIARADLLGLDRQPLATGFFPIIKTSTIFEAIAEVTAFLQNSPEENRRLSKRSNLFSSFPSEEAQLRLLLRGGLQIVGCRICSSDEEINSASAPLLLNNAILPFSLRLIGCIIESPILIGSGQIVTLDLSGSAIAGLDASFLNTSGSFRLRRMMALGPIDCSGARVRGYLDATDCFIRPTRPVSEGQSFAGDRGALNFSQAIIENELYLNRARVWGGISLRGAIANRSIFMDEAIIRSPLAVLEHSTVSLLPSNETAASEVLNNENAERIFGEEARLAAEKIWVRSDGVDKQIRVTLELSQQISGMFDKGTALSQMLSESMRGRTSAFRGDGLKIDGSLFARGLQCSGRARIKYSRIAGGLHLEGSSIRSQEASAAVFDELNKLAAYKQDPWAEEIRENLSARKASYITAASADNPKFDEYALDVSSANIDGKFSLGPSYRSDLGEDFPVEDKIIGKRASIDGPIYATRCTVRGRVDFSRLNCIWSKPKERFDDHLDAVNEGDVQQFNLENSEFGDDIDFRGASNILGVNLDNSHIARGIYFSGKLEVQPQSKQVTQPLVTESNCRKIIADQAVIALCKDRAERLRGVLSLRSTKIDGDAFLLFSPTEGPDIKAQLVEVKGRLDINPQVEKFYINAQGEEIADTAVIFSETAYKKASSFARKSRKQLEKNSRKWSAAEWIARVSPKFIDLKNGSATILNHPHQAWPLQDGLSLSGFVYKRSNDLGPLAPYPFLSSTNTFITNRALIYGFISIIGISILTLLLSLGPTQAFNGHLPLLMLGMTLMGGGCIGLSSIWIRPNAAQSRPMAVRYLARQVSARNRYRRPGNIYVALDPYVTAAAALREEGRPLSANMLELERLRLRTKMLSWRHDPISKIALHFVDRIAGYGFKLQRTSFIAACLICFGAAEIEHAKHDGLLVEDFAKIEVVGTRLEMANVSYPLVARPPKNLSNANSKFTLEVESALSAFTIATDMFVPFLDLKDREKWTVSKEASWSTVILSLVLLGLRIAGLGLTTIVVSSLPIRLETIFSRTAD